MTEQGQSWTELRPVRACDGRLSRVRISPPALPLISIHYAVMVVYVPNLSFTGYLPLSWITVVPLLSCDSPYTLASPSVILHLPYELNPSYRERSGSIPATSQVRCLLTFSCRPSSAIQMTEAVFRYLGLTVKRYNGIAVDVNGTIDSADAGQTNCRKSKRNHAAIREVLQGHFSIRAWNV